MNVGNAQETETTAVLSGHVSRSSGLAERSLQGTVKGIFRKSRPKKTSGKIKLKRDRDGICFVATTRADKNRTRIVSNFFMVLRQF